MSILDRVPGAGKRAGFLEEAAFDLAGQYGRLIPIDVERLAKAIDGAMATFAKAGTLATAPPLAVVSVAFDAVKAGLMEAANKRAAQWAEGCARVIMAVDEDLARTAVGGLAVYKPSESNTLATPVCYLTRKRTPQMLRSQYKPGYVTLLPRPTEDSFLYTPIPVVVAGASRGDLTGLAIEPSIYATNEQMRTLPATWKDAKWWEYLPPAATGLVTAIQALEYLDNRLTAPPVRTSTIVAPCLAPAWGPQGQMLPTGPRMLALAARTIAIPQVSKRATRAKGEAARQLAIVRLSAADLAARAQQKTGLAGKGGYNG